MVLKNRFVVLFLLHKFVLMLRMLQKTIEFLVNITISSGNCVLNSLKILIKIGSFAMFKTIK